MANINDNGTLLFMTKEKAHAEALRFQLKRGSTFLDIKDVLDLGHPNVHRGVWAVHAYRPRGMRMATFDRMRRTYLAMIGACYPIANVEYNKDESFFTMGGTYNER